MSTFFTIAELCKSAKATALNIINKPPPAIEEKLNTLINSLLDNIRREWGSPISVLSGYRCTQLNDEVNGVKNSQHLKGEAADITAGSKAKNKELFNLILDKGFVFDQLIDEKGYSWLHISYKDYNNRQEVRHLS